jgi:hypothetical protein
MTTKAERQAEWKARHLKALEALGFVGSYRTLRTLENRANYNAMLYCNGEDWQNGQLVRAAMTPEEEYETRQERIQEQVKALFAGTLPAGFFINGDPRGYALKIDPGQSYEANYHPEYIPEGLHTDWGGYGILAPEF